MGAGMKQVLIGVIVTVVALILAPVILDQVATVTSNANISNYPGTKSIAELIPLVYIVGVLFLGGFLAFRGLRSGKTGKED